MSEQLPDVLLDIHKWDQLSHDECMEVALQVERLLPVSFRFTNLETYTSGSGQRHIAYFDWTAPQRSSLVHTDFQPGSETPSSLSSLHSCTHEKLLSFPQEEREKLQRMMDAKVSWNEPKTTAFALIPGGMMTLGYDREQHLLPSDELIYDAEEECLIPTVNGARHIFPHDLSLYYDELFQQKEEHDLFENVTPDPEDQEKLPPNYQAITDYMEKLLLPSRMATLRPFLLEKGAFSTKNGRTTYKLVTDVLEKQGFRLPTSDEWEYVCMAGRKKLFFWEESAGPLEYYPELPQNTFGIQIADNSYNWELCMESGILRGGDGGYTQCGWAGYFAHYLVYTSAFYQTYDPAHVIRAYFRRAYSL